MRLTALLLPLIAVFVNAQTNKGRILPKPTDERKCLSWIDEEGKSSSQLPRYIWGDKCQSKNVFLGVHFESGYKSWGIWNVDKWDALYEKPKDQKVPTQNFPWKSSGFLSKCNMNGVFKDSNQNSAFSTAGKCTVGEAKNPLTDGFSLNKDVRFGGNFKPVRSGWKWAKFTACCGDGEVSWHLDKGDTTCAQTCAKRDLHCVNNHPGQHNANQFNTIVKEVELMGVKCTSTPTAAYTYNPVQKVSNNYCYYSKKLNWSSKTAVDRCTGEKPGSSWNLFCACSTDTSYSVTLYNNQAWGKPRDDIDWINSMLPGTRYMGEMCYRMTRDGYSSTQFWDKCSEKGDFVVVIRTQRGNVFGAYSGYTWNKKNHGSYQRCPDDKRCFLWMLTTWNSSYHRWQSENYRYEQYATYVHTSYGPCFGYSSFDLCIDGPTTPQGITYGSRQSYETPNKSTYYMDVSNSNRFKMVDWEVFLVRTTDAPTSSPTVVPCGDGRDKRRTCELYNDLGDKTNRRDAARNAVGGCEEDPTVIMLLRDDQSWVFVTETPEQAYLQMVKFLRDQSIEISGKHPLEISYPYTTRDGKDRKFVVASDMDLWSAIQLQRNFDTINLYIEITSISPTSSPTTNTPSVSPTAAPTRSPTFESLVFTTGTTEDMSFLNEMLKQPKAMNTGGSYSGGQKMGTMFYRMSRDGQNINVWYDKVAGKGKHICVVRRDCENYDCQNTDNQVFGSYADLQWIKGGSWKYCDGCMLFILRDGRFTNYVGYVNSYRSNAAYMNSSYGPCFGGTHDYCINSPSTPYGYSNWGYTYKKPWGHNSRYYIGNVYNFYIKDWECYTTTKIE